jgi:hypothetical protein
VCLAVPRWAGFSSLDAGAESGRVTTRPFMLPSAKLRLNAAASRGFVQAALLDPNGQVRCEAQPPSSGSVIRLRLTARHAALFRIGLNERTHNGRLPNSGGNKRRLCTRVCSAAAVGTSWRKRFAPVRSAGAASEISEYLPRAGQPFLDDCLVARLVRHTGDVQRPAGENRVAPVNKVISVGGLGGEDRLALDQDIHWRGVRELSGSERPAFEVARELAVFRSVSAGSDPKAALCDHFTSARDATRVRRGEGLEHLPIDNNFHAVELPNRNSLNLHLHAFASTGEANLLSRARASDAQVQERSTRCERLAGAVGLCDGSQIENTRADVRAHGANGLAPLVNVEVCRGSNDWPEAKIP